MGSHQWEGTLVTVGAGPGTTVGGVSGLAAGLTATRSFPVTGFSQSPMGRDAFFTHGIFGLSLTSFVGGQNWTVGVWGNVGGVSVKIAEISGISGTSAGPLPIVNESILAPTGILGTTQSSFIGIPLPKSVIFTGSSAGIGITVSGIVTGSLRSV